MRYYDDHDDFRGYAPRRASRFAIALKERPADLVALAAGIVITLTVIANALVGQNGPHPSPLFAPARSDKAAAHTVPTPLPRPTDPQQTASIQPRAAEAAAPAARPVADVVGDAQRELKRLGFYDGTFDGRTGPKTQAAVKAFQKMQGIAQTGEIDETLVATLRKAKRGAARTEAATPPRAQPAAPAPRAEAPPLPVRQVQEARIAEAKPVVAEAKPVTMTQRPAPEVKAANEPKLSVEPRIPEKSIASLIDSEEPRSAKLPPAFSAKQTQQIEKALSLAGYGPGKVDGVYDRDTRDAIQRFERDRKLPVTGDLSPRLVKELAAVSGTSIE